MYKCDTDFKNLYRKSGCYTFEKRGICTQPVKMFSIKYYITLLPNTWFVILGNKLFGKYFTLKTEF